MWKSLVLVASLRLSKGQVVNAREDVQETGSAQGRGVQAVCMQAWERWFQEEREENETRGGAKEGGFYPEINGLLFRILIPLLPRLEFSKRYLLSQCS